MTSTPEGFAESADKMPVLLVGHDSPVNAIEESEFDRGWAEVGRTLSRPQMTFCVSAHWWTRSTHVIAMASPRTTHDSTPKHIAGGE